MSTVKHYSFCSGPMRGKPVTALPGIGETYGFKLTCAGYSLASDIYEKFKSLGFESCKCQNWLNMIAGVNSRYSSMCYEAIKEWHEQFGETQTSPRYSDSKRLELEYVSPLRPTSVDDFCGINLTPPKQESACRNKSPEITRAEVLKMMTQFQKKQDALTARIDDLEQEKARAAAKIISLETEQMKTNDYVKTLEARVKQMDRIATVLQQQQNTSVEQYKNISSSVYLLNQKLEETLEKNDKSSQDSIVTSFIKILEARIERIDDNSKKMQKEQEKKNVEITKTLKTLNGRVELTNKITTNIDILSEKIDKITKKQSSLTHRKSSMEVSLEGRIERMEKDLSNLAIDISKLLKNRSGKINQEPVLDKNIVGNIQDVL